VGTWRDPARGEMELHYDPAWRASEQGRPLSLSLPFDLHDRPLKGGAVEAYFENLLPDSIAIRRRVAARYAHGSTDVFDLLEAIGRDCVGAVQLLPEEATPEGFDRIEGTPMTEEEIARHLRTTLTLPARGLEVADCEMLSFEGQPVLSVKRFDRQLHSSGKWLLRLPQEDFCQANGVLPSRKYQADGGPGLPQLTQMLRSSVNAERDIESVLTCQILFWMLAATDGHAKNFSIRLLPAGRFQLTPLYDMMSVWPIEGDGPNQISWHVARLAMAVAARKPLYRLREIERRHFNAMAARCGYGRDAEPLIERLLDATPKVIAQVSATLPREFPERVAARIFEGLQGAATRLQAMPPN
jgi:HipA-like protein